MDVTCEETTWRIGDRLGGGGYATVYHATSDDGRLGAAKFVPKEAGAERELLFANPTGARNVMPVIDQGETNTHWVLVMPLASGSLEAEIAAAAPITPAAATAILLDIAYALVDLEALLVHRDLKPANILLYQNKWCLADFGISRYTAAATAADTRKWSLTAPYASPEQFRGEHATNATDIYSFGVVAYELLTGRVPFAGPRYEDFRDQHLHDIPAPLPGDVPPRMVAMLEECLTKPAAARPTAADVLSRLLRLAPAVERPSPPGAAQLAAAGAQQARRQAEAGAISSRAQTAAERRSELINAATAPLRSIVRELCEAIEEHAGVKAIGRGPDMWSIKLGDAELTIDPPAEVRRDMDSRADPALPEVLAHARIGVAQPPDRSGYRGRSHSLYFCDAQTEGTFGWYETAFMHSPMLREPLPATAPMALLPTSGEALGALRRAMDIRQVAWPFTRLAADDLDDFIDRWLGWFGQAAAGALHYPSPMPERDVQGTWRQ